MFARWQKVLLATSALVPLGLSPAYANPFGAQVVGGTATVQGQGTSNVTVNQTTDRAIINWNTFNIGTGEKTQFIQPNSSSVALNRVTGGLGPSQIYGSLSANGRIFVVNPDGILIGPTGKIDTAGFLATTNDIKNDDFMAGRYNFSIPGRSDASIVNQGAITAQTGGFAALVAPGVRNTGTITATLGKIGLASGNEFSLDFYGDKLITLGLSDSIATTVKDVSTGQTLKSLVNNEGTLNADGGRVELTAVAARKIVDSVINTSGVIEANSIGTQNGMIVLGGATSANKPAGAPTETVKISGKLSTAGKNAGESGGKIQITGEIIQLTGANIDASGTTGGGTVLIGGDWSGGHPVAEIINNPAARLESNSVPNAMTTSVDADSTIDASAIQTGDGGKVIVWADGTTSFAGNIGARGGATAGNGGFVETSGHSTLNFSGTIDTRAPNGAMGMLLLDPYNLIIQASGIDTVSASGGVFSSIDNNSILTTASLEKALALNDVTLFTGAAGTQAGDITVASSFRWSSGAQLKMLAARNININDGVTIINTSKTGLAGAPDPGIFTLRADSLGTGTGTVNFIGSGNIDFTNCLCKVEIYYNPSGPNKYQNPVDFSSSIFTNNTTSFLSSFMLVNNINDLQAINSNLSGSYSLGQDIDASATAGWNSGVGFLPIGSAASPFIGQLTGGGYIIDSLTINSSAPDVGMFGYIGGPFGKIDSILLSNVDINATGGTWVGALAGKNDGSIVDSWAAGSVGGAGFMVGGLVGSNAGYIGRSFAVVDVNVSTALTGGLVGYNNGIIDTSYAAGNISSGGNSVVGGLIGINDIGGTTTSSAAIGNVSSIGSNSWLGGLIGGNAGTINQSATSGSVTGTSESLIGGFVGINLGVIADSGTTTTAAVTGVGTNNFVGGFVGANFGLIDPSISTGAVTGGNSNTVGGFAGANASLANFASGLIPGSTFPVGTLVNSLATGVATGGTGSTVGTQIGSANPPGLPTSPSIIASCGNGGLCSIAQAGFVLAPPITTIPTTLATVVPYPTTQFDLMTSGILAPQAPILISLTLPQSIAGYVGSPDYADLTTSSIGAMPNAVPGEPDFLPPPLPRRSVVGPDGEAFSSVPPPGENRFIKDQILLELNLNISEAELTTIAQGLGLQIIGSDMLPLLRRRLIRLKLPPGLTVQEAIRRLEANRIVSIAAPIYQFHLMQAGRTKEGDTTQYVLNELNLNQAHQIATGKGVTVAVIDSIIDKRHRELQGAVLKEFDTIGEKEPPQVHGTAMTGAIVAHGQLIGVAPDAKILTVGAFSQSKNSTEGTTISIIKGIEWAVSEGAQIINMSFAGPRDPALDRVLKAAYQKGVVLIAAAGNAGPKSPPLYPGADPDVIAVTATDFRNQLFGGANRGAQLSVAAPGVDIIAPAPDESYELSTGTSIATAHVSGVVALMLQRDPTLKPREVRKILESTATDLGPKGKDGQFGWGLVNAQKALTAVVARHKVSDVSSKKD